MINAKFALHISTQILLRNNSGSSGGNWEDEEPCPPLPRGTVTRGEGVNCDEPWLPMPPGNPGSDLTLDDIKNYKNISVLVEIMEQTAGINASNFDNIVFLGDASETIPSPNGYSIYINKHLSLVLGLFSYVHELNNAANIDQIRTLIYNAHNNVKTPAHRSEYADGMAFIEAKGIYQQLTVAYETHNENSITLPDYIIQAYADSKTGVITQSAAVNIFFDYVKSGAATDEQGYSIYQGYLDFYDSL